MKKQNNMTYEELREALIKHPKVLDSLSPINQVVLREILKRDLGKKRGG